MTVIPRAHQPRWMMFVDGENLTIRAQKLREAQGRQDFIRGEFWERDVFIWYPGDVPRAVVHGSGFGEQSRRTRAVELPVFGAPLRSYYYTSATGDGDTLARHRDALWNIGFDPLVFKKSKRGEKAKGVDIALSKDLLSHAFHGNYEAAVLVAGDRDYLPLVEEVKRLGKLVILAFFTTGGGLSDELRRECDGYINIEQHFLDRWSQWSREHTSDEAASR